MSSWLRVTIGVMVLINAPLFVLVGTLLVVVPDDEDTKASAIGCYFSAVLCLVVASACFSASTRSITFRIIGGVCCSVYLFSAYFAFENNLYEWLILGFIFYAVPCGYLTIFGRYPRWGKFGEVFALKSQSKNNRLK